MAAQLVRVGNDTQHKAKANLAIAQDTLSQHVRAGWDMHVPLASSLYDNSSLSPSPRLF